MKYIERTRHRWSPGSFGALRFSPGALRFSPGVPGSSAAAGSYLLTETEQLDTYMTFEQ